MCFTTFGGGLQYLPHCINMLIWGFETKWLQYDFKYYYIEIILIYPSITYKRVFMQEFKTDEREWQDKRPVKIIYNTIIACNIYH